MATVQINQKLWEKLTDLAQRQRKQPNRLLEKILSEYLLIQKELGLDEEIRKELKDSGYQESDAVELVNRYRRKKAT